jgi:hypothetical protein
MAKSRVFEAKWFERFAQKELIEDAILLEAIARVEKGSVDADLGGGVIKQRMVRRGQGKSGGYRAIVFFRTAKRAVFVYGFAKSERDNIRSDEVKAFKEAAKHVLALTETQVAALVRQGDFVEVKAKRT